VVDKYIRSIFSILKVKMPTNKSLSNSSVANETSVSVVHVTISKSLIDCSQVQVDSVVKIVRQSPILSKLT